MKRHRLIGYALLLGLLVGIFWPFAKVPITDADGTVVEERIILRWPILTGPMPYGTSTRKSAGSEG